MRRRDFDLQMLDADVWDEPAILGELDCLEALGDDRPRRPSQSGEDIHEQD